ncbi:MAG: glycosyltransferase family 4 protein [Bdellovibrionales bacterium]
MNFHVCFVGQNLPLTAKASDQENVWPIADKLSEMGVRVSIISHKSPSNESVIRRKNIDIHFVASGNNFISKEEFPKAALKKLREVHQLEKIDHVHSLDTSLKGFKSQLQPNKPSLSYGVQVSRMEEMFSLLSVDESLLGLLVSNLLNPLIFLKKYFFKDYFILREAQGVFVNSPKQALSLERYYLYPPNWIFKIPLDSHVSDLILRKKSEKLLEQLNLSLKTPIVATSSSMEKPDELLYLLDVFEEVALIHPKAKFLVVGNGPYFKEIEKTVLLKALDSRVIFTKNIPKAQLPDYISLSDVFINISYATSGFGPTLIEAMAQEKIIIGSEFSPISSIIEDGKNGFLIRPGETTKCANLIDQVFTGTMDTEKIGKTAREDIKKILDRDKLTEKTLKAFKKINSRGFKLFSIPFFN